MAGTNSIIAYVTQYQLRVGEHNHQFRNTTEELQIGYHSSNWTAIHDGINYQFNFQSYSYVKFKGLLILLPI